MTRRSVFVALLAAASAVGLVAISPGDAATQKDDPLPSWNDTPAKRALLDFVARVTAEGGKDFVPAAERVATFDNDGTLWCEQPMYVQAMFMLDRIKAA